MKKLFILMLTLLVTVLLVACTLSPSLTVDTGKDTSEPTAHVTTTAAPSDTLTPENTETTVPDAEITTPEVETTTPDVETTTPDVETTTPEVETTTPEAETTTPDVETTTPEAETTTPDVETTAPVCAHDNTALINAKECTCTENGYTGDTVCSSCGDTVSAGTVITAEGHKTTLINVKKATCEDSGYSGDKYCTVCKTTVEQGKTVAATGHTKTETVGAKTATCTSEGYSGDKVCKACDYTVEKGETIPKTDHKPTLVGYVAPTTSAEGFSGDTVCSSCGEVLEHGTALPKIEEAPKYIEVTQTENGKEYHFMVPVDGDAFEYTIEQANKKYTSPCADIEERILYLVNIERAKVGAAPLTMEHRADYFTHLRAVEIIEFFSHTRPDGSSWATAYYEEGVYLESAAENLVKSTYLYEAYGEDYDVAAHFVNLWMNSEGHRNAILNADYKTISVSVVIDAENGVYTGVQHFFG